ncbi:hypothetical protein BDB01DRAFT_771772 [Pilobolus umbonatus]|nr:hypothetical protein BDB01DRAFT_771772 [Pilobolus umbonatus]
MIKNIGKFKQWTEEKLGSAKQTLQSDEIHKLEVETEKKRIAYEKVHAAAVLTQIQLAKKKVSPEDNKTKRPPLDILGVCWNNYSEEFTDKTNLGAALINYGQVQSKIAGYQEDFATGMRSEYLDRLDDGLQQFREYQILRRKLESRRLDYDAKLGRLQKSKKEKPEWEQEMQASKMKYEETEYDLVQKMASIQEFEDKHCDGLHTLLELQIEYFSQSLEELKRAKQDWEHDAPSINHVKSIKMTALSRTSSDDSANYDDHFHDSANTRAQRIPRKNSSETTSARRVPSRNNSGLSDRNESGPTRIAPPILPRRQSQASSPPKNQRKAIYDFAGDNHDEISFQTGDIIQVIEEVDEGWWYGEIGSRKGIFPVNYTEAVHTTPPSMPSRPSMVPSYIEEEEEEEEDKYYNKNKPYASEPEPFESSPFHDKQNTSRGYLYANRPPITHSMSSSSSHSGRTLSANLNTIPSPATSPVPRSTKPISQQRAPPPPPMSRQSTSRTNSSIKGVRTAPPTPHANRNEYFDVNASCGECGCDDFSANLFKKGQCNNCFHKH